MSRGAWAVWVVWVVCAIGGCGGPQYYTAPPENLPAPTNVNGTAVQIIDQRPDWEKKPFTGTVCLYHLGKAHAWEQLAEQTSATVAALPQPPERVEVVVSSFQLVRSGDTAKPYRDISGGANPTPNVMSQGVGRNAPDQGGSQPGMGMSSNAPMQQKTPDAPPNRLELAFAPKGDPRRMLTEHPPGVSCSIEATIKLIFPGGNVQTIPVKSIARAPNDSGTEYYGQAIDNAARAAVFDYASKFRTAVGIRLN
jgi:hypothetical protein